MNTSAQRLPQADGLRWLAGAAGAVAFVVPAIVSAVAITLMLATVSALITWAPAGVQAVTVPNFGRSHWDSARAAFATLIPGAGTTYGSWLPVGVVSESGVPGVGFLLLTAVSIIVGLTARRFLAAGAIARWGYAASTALLTGVLFAVVVETAGGPWGNFVSQNDAAIVIATAVAVVLAIVLPCGALAASYRPIGVGGLVGAVGVYALATGAVVMVAAAIYVGDYTHATLEGMSQEFSGAAISSALPVALGGQMSFSVEVWDQKPLLSSPLLRADGSLKRGLEYPGFAKRQVKGPMSATAIIGTIRTPAARTTAWILLLVAIAFLIGCIVAGVRSLGAPRIADGALHGLAGAAGIAVYMTGVALVARPQASGETPTLFGPSNGTLVQSTIVLLAAGALIGGIVALLRPTPLTYRRRGSSPGPASPPAEP